MIDSTFLTPRARGGEQLGKAEAVRRLKASFSDTQPSGGSFLVLKNQWSGDHLDFRASVLGQSATGTVDVADDHVRLEVQLPWLVSLLANKAKALVLTPPPNQSLRDTPSACGPGSQSVRVCNDDFRSCNSICTATALDPTADIASCSLNCCTKFNTCLRMRSCGARVISCF
jgi:Putative polyhydroxyalkanoic acid system protein (PHA_gran_rgn)